MLITYDCLEMLITYDCLENDNQIDFIVYDGKVDEIFFRHFQDPRGTGIVIGYNDLLNLTSNIESWIKER